jgi:hypothetical protein
MHIVTDELQEKRDVMSPALVPNALDEGVLLIVDLAFLERSVVEQHLDAVRACLLQSPY